LVGCVHPSSPSFIPYWHKPSQRERDNTHKAHNCLFFRPNNFWYIFSLQPHFSPVLPPSLPPLLLTSLVGQATETGSESAIRSVYVADRCLPSSCRCCY
jgi:hypothetical protein